MNIAQIVATHESLQEAEIKDSGDHEYRGDFHSPVTPLDAVNAEAELEAEYKDISDVDTGIDTAIDSVSALDELHDAVKEDLPEDGSLSKLEEVSIQASLESILTSVGLTYTVPTTESLTSIERTKQLVASLEDNSKGIFDRLIAAFKRTVDSVVAFLQNLFRNTWVLSKYMEWVRTKLDKVTAQVAEKKEMTESAKAVFASGESSYDSVVKMNATAESLIKMSLEAVDEINDINFKFSDADNRVNRDTIPDRKLARNHNGYGYLANGRTFLPSEESMFRISRLFERTVAVGTPGKTAEILSRKDMDSTLKMAADIITGIRKIDSKRSVIRNLTSRIVQGVAQIATGYAGAVSKSARDKNYTLRVIGGKRRVLNSAVGRFPLEAFKIAKAFIDYVRHSLKYYPS